MIRLELEEQELFDLIMALHAFQKTDAEHGVPAKCRKYEQLAQCRANLLDKLHDAFEAQSTPPRQKTEGAANLFEMTPRSP